MLTSALQLQLGIADEEDGGAILEVVATRDVTCLETCWLVEHAWTWEGGKAAAAEGLRDRAQLKAHLQGTLSPLLEAPAEVDELMQRMCECSMSYEVATAPDAPPSKRFFIPDVLACHLREAGAQATSFNGQTAEVDRTVSAVNSGSDFCC